MVREVLKVARQRTDLFSQLGSWGVKSVVREGVVVVVVVDWTDGGGKSRTAVTPHPEMSLLNSMPQGQPSSYSDEKQNVSSTFFVDASGTDQRPREVAILVNALAPWLVSKVTAKPLPDFLKDPKYKGNGNGDLNTSKAEDVDQVVRYLLAFVTKGAQVEPNGDDTGSVFTTGKIVPGVRPLSFVDVYPSTKQAQKDERYAEYENALNAAFGSKGVYRLTKEEKPFGTGEIKTPPPAVRPGWVSDVLDKAKKPNGQQSVVVIGSGISDMPLVMFPGGKNGGAVGDQVTETIQYVPTIPRVSEVRRSTTPCMYERKVQKGEGYWAWTCNRTDQPGVKKCDLVRVEDQKQTLVPIQCLQEYVNVLKGFEVQKTSKEGADGKTTVTQTITPEVQVYGTVTPKGPTGRPIPYRDLPKYSEQYPAPAPQFPNNSQYISMNGVSSQALDRDLGGGGRAAGAAPTAAAASRSGAAASRGGAMSLPSRTNVRDKQFYLTNQDIEDITTGVPSDMIPKPATWANINPPEDPNQISFYTYDDSYGSASTSRLQNGFPFSSNYLPFAYMTNQAYLEWLVSLDYKMRAEFSDEHTHVYDPLLDTIATVETAILVTLGRLEAKRQYFNRPDLFEGKEPFKAVMHRYLRVFAFTPPQNEWYSPLSGRYIALPEKDKGVFPPSEEAALNTLQLLNDLVVRTALAGSPASGISEGFRIPLKYRTFFGNRVNQVANTTLLDPRWSQEDKRVVGIAEDEVLSTLARLQFIHGYAINLNGNEDLKNTSDALLKPEHRRYLSRELVRYLDMFSLEDGQPALHRLPGLRMKAAAERGFVMPKSAMSEYGSDWSSAANAALPGASQAPRRPVSRIETLVRNPAITTRRSIRS
jgi:hypothetical protein